jgi:hypothetical protein
MKGSNVQERCFELYTVHTIGVFEGFRELNFTTMKENLSTVHINNFSLVFHVFSTVSLLLWYFIS